MLSCGELLFISVCYSLNLKKLMQPAMWSISRNAIKSSMMLVHNECSAEKLACPHSLLMEHILTCWENRLTESDCKAIPYCICKSAYLYKLHSLVLSLHVPGLWSHAPPRHMILALNSYKNVDIPNQKQPWGYKKEHTAKQCRINQTGLFNMTGI